MYCICLLTDLGSVVSGCLFFLAALRAKAIKISRDREHFETSEFHLPEMCGQRIVGNLRHLSASRADEVYVLCPGQLIQCLVPLKMTSVENSGLAQQVHRVVNRGPADMIGRLQIRVEVIDVKVRTAFHNLVENFPEASPWPAWRPAV